MRADLMERFPQIQTLVNVHVWTITSDMLVFSAHIAFDETVKVCEDHDTVIARIDDYLKTRYHVIESTIQIVPRGTAVCEVDA
jgi:Co/Zn/Cd efflux system component